MILGATRTPFNRPAAASGSFQPMMPGTGFFSHFQPLTMVMQAMPAATGYRPPYPPTMGPTPLPAVPPPAPPVAPGGTKGFGAAGFGSTGGVRGGGGHSHVNPYSVIRSGMFPGINPNASNIRAGVRNAGARVHRGFPFQTAPLPALPPVAPAPAAVAPGGTKGFGYFGDDEFGAHRGWRGRGYPMRRRRSWVSRAIVPETYAEVVQPRCETYPPNMDGIRITVCDGRVVRYEDAQGNVRIPGQLPPGFAGW